MIVRTIKTKIITKNDRLFEIIDQSIQKLQEKTILAITSKIIALIEGRVIKKSEIDKGGLIEKEADLYIKPIKPDDFYLTIKNDILIPSAGIDESNAGEYYILWPKDPQRSANIIREYIVDKFKLKNLGVLITDSTTAPLRWGVKGIAIAHSGFSALNDYVGKPDLLGRKLKVTKVNVVDALAAAAVLTMGEGNEQMPLALIEDIPFVQFQDRNPTKKELEELRISLDDDLYSPLLKTVKWKKKKNDC
ncbi:hypothetical protein A3C23_03890 [Candidatus Roizmanbacteria bacterium RIFCSPHIGHO2_02_FULL_37_13b]|uniref:Coenzyme F420:L-glutamate ligase-like domain-containing protein n=1 Tax=Candidatus Roizmanbacteria bacterium RIFCSPLOWO2_02_FULL_36_11 TaxID=1802071 RepID=A0A1F7JC50_9BACT|nr:MAG: hypothetical protein A3C23_03890 [Candidatus Roizmanbacteria bacterium RIFCSPHIGHO2_02_FULL_37_13b]OGK53172.1 MAG: hypothetical protein A3H78_06190 [Candidatus Roizmanbacteria bacterium RIFCSPLOWO2_02_FULL_36_11]